MMLRATIFRMLETPMVFRTAFFELCEFDLGEEPIILNDENGTDPTWSVEILLLAKCAIHNLSRLSTGIDPAVCKRRSFGIVKEVVGPNYGQCFE